MQLTNTQKAMAAGVALVVAYFLYKKMKERRQVPNVVMGPAQKK